MRIVLVLLLVLCLIGSASAQERPDTPADKNFAGDLGVLMTFRSMYPRTLELLKEEFPADYAVLLSHLAEIDEQQGRADQLLLAAFRKLGEVREKYAGKLIFAPGLQLSVMLGRLADFYDLVVKQDGPAVCGRFAGDGSAVLFEMGIADRYAVALDLQSFAYFDAVVKAIETPDYVGVVAPGDWGAVLGAMVYAGAPPSYVQTIGVGDETDPDLCPALAAMFRTSGLLQTPEGARTRADFGKNLSGY
jgi:hypothetical protein